MGGKEGARGFCNRPRSLPRGHGRLRGIAGRQKVDRACGHPCAAVFGEFDKEGTGSMATAHLEAALERLGQDPAVGMFHWGGGWSG